MDGVRQMIVDEIHPPSFVGAGCLWHPALMKALAVLRVARPADRCESSGGPSLLQRGTLLPLHRLREETFRVYGARRAWPQLNM